jgi:hypothetical protein
MLPSSKALVGSAGEISYDSIFEVVTHHHQCSFLGFQPEENKHACDFEAQNV